MFRSFKSTRFKIAIGKLLYIVLKVSGLSKAKVVRRQGVLFRVDPAEGIELSIFLFGKFQDHVVAKATRGLPVDSVILDVGANTGWIALNFARIFKYGKIYCFEPTDFAFEKLQSNIRLNGDAFTGRMHTYQTFVSDNNSTESVLKAYSSWPVDGDQEDMHPVHRGLAKSAAKNQLTLDYFAEANNLHRIDLVKIDTDGHELAVLNGAKKIIAQYRPRIVFELATYLLEEQEQSVDDIIKVFGSSNYELTDLLSGQTLTVENARKLVPPKGSIDVLAMPL